MDDGQLVWRPEEEREPMSQLHPRIGQSASLLNGLCLMVAASIQSKAMWRSGKGGNENACYQAFDLWQSESWHSMLAAPTSAIDLLSRF
jgi:hypothetical protein